ncbi:MAG TPA: prepilin-type N-terminal cleavage/methylation domain-containing protein [Candidatus Saccharimonadales bacterium]|nr:prepilin-type N-terminal cleavage/methylation domain-containing protein [Candidatus Saccharimonadales bacterium]
MHLLLPKHYKRPGKQPLNAAGFTLVELIVVMVLTLLFSGLIMSFFLDLWGSTATLENDSETFVGREDAGDALRDVFNSASGLINQNGIADTYTNNPDPGNATGNYWLILHAIPGTTAMPSSGTTPVLYFQAPSVTSSRVFIMNGTQPYQDNFVLYLDGSTKSLMLRSLANPSASGDRITTSCPPSQASASCPADKTIVKDIASVSERYFSRSGNTLDWTSITDPLTGSYIGPDFPSVEVLELTVNLHRNSVLHGGTNTSNETIIRVAFRNG